MRDGDGTGALLAIGAAPRLPQPVGGIEARRILPLDPAKAFEAQAAEHRIDQPLMRQKPPDLGEVDAGGDRGMRRRPQKQELSDTEPQDVLDDRGARRQRRVKAFGDQRIDLAKPAQHGRHQKPGKGTVARRQFGHPRMFVDRIVERPIAVQNRPDQVESDLTCGRRGRRQGSTVRFCCRHWRDRFASEVAAPTPCCKRGSGKSAWHKRSPGA